MSFNCIGFDLPRRHLLILLPLLLLAALLRILAARGDLWLDEIWSWSLAGQMHHPLDVLLKEDLQIDNNHPLNTLWLWYTNTAINPLILRLPAIVAGIGTLLLTVRVSQRAGRDVLLSVLLLGFSFSMIEYGSEARGYALAAFFSLAMMDAAELYLQRATAGRALYFAAMLGLGVLSHLTTIYVYAGLCAWTVIETLRICPRNPSSLTLYAGRGTEGEGSSRTRDRDARSVSAQAPLSPALSPCTGRGRSISALLSLHALPVLLLAIYFRVFVKNLAIGGAPPQPLWQGLIAAFGGLIGFVGSRGWQAAGTVAAFIFFAWLIVDQLRRGSRWWVFVVAGVLSSLAMVIRQFIALDHPQPMSTRYFLVLLPPLAILFSATLLSVARPIRVTLVAALLIINLYQAEELIRVGRGQYSRALQVMSESTPQPATVLSKHPLRATMLLQFFNRELPTERKLRIVEMPRPTTALSDPPDWLILESPTVAQPMPTLIDPGIGAAYRFKEEFPFSGLSGYCWELYRRSH